MSMSKIVDIITFLPINPFQCLRKQFTTRRQLLSCCCNAVIQTDVKFWEELRKVQLIEPLGKYSGNMEYDTKIPKVIFHDFAFLKYHLQIKGIFARMALFQNSTKHVVTRLNECEFHYGVTDIMKPKTTSVFFFFYINLFGLAAKTTSSHRRPMDIHQKKLNNVESVSMS